MNDDHILFPVTGQYFPQYYPTTNPECPTSTTPPVRGTESAQRRRQKYTRSKTGCLTCRVKKIKCDETKPICTRCTHGMRECSWPEGSPTRKRTTSKRGSIDDRPLTLESYSEPFALSESPPSGREQTPPSRSLVDLASSSHRSSHSYENMMSTTYNQEPCSVYPNQRSYSFPDTSAGHYTMQSNQNYASPDPPMVYEMCGTSYRPHHHPPQTNAWGSESDAYYHNHHVSLHDRMPTVQPILPQDHPQYRFFAPL